ncbi:peptidase U32 family protein [Mogibacterium pumilum]|uniref:Peptidase U32 n=1 Tax=Mogibacterium pumilum TaxID=86332 RepID=A0A223ASS9_9FIRM|nr:U32 family peptidase [Mogibacterium pumilum]ASS38023.1 peptidase U32 [Mogibacterium pumilum]
MTKKKIELLAPAGDMEKLKTAIIYGADAVYFGGELFSLRAGAGNLSIDEIREAMDFIHEHDAKGYMTINIYPHNDDIPPLKAYLEKIKDIPIDAFIVSDPGVMTIVKGIIPYAEIHISTQANTTNYMTAAFWVQQMGATRIVAAREMSLKELREMKKVLPPNTEIEAFVHGAMCMSYSGRCLLSNFMVGRDANRGSCTHPCRWKYSLVEEKRPGEYYPIEEDERGSYIMNSRDLCMLDKLPDLIDAGIYSLKIEGRMKSPFYVATVVSAYRAALDSYLDNPDTYEFQEKWFTELCKASHREFYHGFYYSKPDSSGQNYSSSDYTREYSFIGVVRGFESDTGLTVVEQRNKFSVGEDIEVFGPRTEYADEIVREMYDEDNNPIELAPHPQQVIKVKLSKTYPENFILRKKK